MSSPPLLLEPRVSPLLRAALLALAAAAVAALLMSAAPGWTLVVPALLLALAWPRAPQFARVALHDDGGVRAFGADGTESALEARALALRGAWMIARFDAAGRRVELLFGPDTLGAADRRRLRLWFDRHAPRGDGGVVAHV